MPRKLTADDICEAIAELGETTRAKLVADILCDLADFMTQGPVGNDTDTWESGFQSAMQVIKSNYSC